MGQALEAYVSDTKALGWISATIPPLEREPVIAAYEEDGTIKHVKARYTAQGGWSEGCLQGRPFYWIYDPRAEPPA